MDEDFKEWNFWGNCHGSWLVVTDRKPLRTKGYGYILNFCRWCLEVSTPHTKTYQTEQLFSCSSSIIIVCCDFSSLRTLPEIYLCGWQFEKLRKYLWAINPEDKFDDDNFDSDDINSPKLQMRNPCAEYIVTRKSQSFPFRQKNEIFSFPGNIWYVYYRLLLNWD